MERSPPDDDAWKMRLAALEPVELSWWAGVSPQRKWQNFLFLLGVNYSNFFLFFLRWFRRLSSACTDSGERHRHSNSVRAKTKLVHFHLPLMWAVTLQSIIGHFWHRGNPKLSAPRCSKGTRMLMEVYAVFDGDAWNVSQLIEER